MSTIYFQQRQNRRSHQRFPGYYRGPFFNHAHQTLRYLAHAGTARHALLAGGVAAALATAITWRDRAVRGPTLSLREFHAKVRTVNRSGVSGVQKYFKASLPEGWWQARIKLADGREKTRSFSIQKYGDAEAFRRAVAARKELLRLVEDRPYLNSPAAKHLARASARPSQPP